jgi:hypothetical protein
MAIMLRSAVCPGFVGSEDEFGDEISGRNRVCADVQPGELESHDLGELHDGRL